MAEDTKPFDMPTRQVGLASGACAQGMTQIRVYVVANVEAASCRFS